VDLLKRIYKPTRTRHDPITFPSAYSFRAARPRRPDARLHGYDRPYDRRWSRAHGHYGAYAYGGLPRHHCRRQHWDGTMVVKHIRRCD
jgi:erythromycin esterase-like protein